MKLSQQDVLIYVAAVTRQNWFQKLQSLKQYIFISYTQ